MTRFFIHRPIFACSIALLMLLAGGVSILALPIAQYPDIVPGTVQVSASYPGASAEVTERVITNPLAQDRAQLVRVPFVRKAGETTVPSVVDAATGKGVVAQLEVADSTCSQLTVRCLVILFDV